IFLYLTDLVVIFDHLLNRVRIVATVKIGNGMPAGKAYDLSVEMIEDLEEKMMENNAPVSGSGIYSPGDKILPKFEFDSNFKKEDFLGAVEKSKFYITRGDAFQVVLSQRFSVGSYEEPLGIYRALRSINPSPYMYFFNFGDFYVAGASPEPLIKIDGKKVFTCPIAGTRERGATPAEEEVLMKSLLNDRKEIAEHNMLVDLARNDLGRVCRYGSVEVKKYMDIEKYSHVMHLVSRVEGVLNDRSSIYDALRSVFPAGTLSGAPKIRAMQIISELEPDRRGPYGGAVGYFGYDGSLDSCITIRTAVVKEKRVYIQAGAGIVYDSIPENEYEETINKAAALFNALKIMR
ncbi:MAG: anthranilate synthase component I family protein, partial [Actinobacteria bacterium]|nr:anthranilate synthase component I family protein [Actinomycetota bacterium]